MELDGFLYEAFYLVFAFADSHTAWKVRYVCTPTRFTLFENNHISHNYFFNPACFRTLFNVPTGMSILSLPAIVTVPGFVGW